jgi:Flavodoxins
MAKSLIVYFTQGGTTAQVAEAIASGLRSQKHQVDLHNMNDGKPPGLDGYDLLGIGLPVYIFRPPFKVMEYIHGLPELKGLPFFVFLLYGSLPGDAGNIVRRALTRKGGNEVGYFKARGADYYLGNIKSGYLFSPDNPTGLELDAAKTFGISISDRIAGAGYIREEDDNSPPFVYRFERFLTNKWFVKYNLSLLFFVKSKKCNSCGLCMKICPAGNITKNQKGHPVWGRNCLFCLYCEMKCPTEAIISPASWPIFSPLNSYNIRKTCNDSSNKYVRVIHEKGHTKRVD